MNKLATTSIGRTNLRLQNWSIYLSQFQDHISVQYRRGVDMGCPDALSCLRYEVSDLAKQMKQQAESLGKKPDTDEFEVSEVFVGIDDTKEFED